jgi:2-keto-3-deoxy-L-fuconate dehydrogenase
MRRLAGKAALVSAAAEGIGRAIALRLAEEGASVIAIDINAKRLAEFSHPKITTVAMDATDKEKLAGVIASMPTIDILVNCVGWVHQGTILQCPPDDWHRSFVLNVDTVYDAIRLSLPKMVQARKGSIINISSVAGQRSAPNRAAYSSTKAAIVGLTKSVASDFAKDGIRCNAICPAMIETPSLQARIRDFRDPAAARALFASRHPVGRLGEPWEVAALAAYLASDESAFMTGSALLLDGGAAA